MCALTLFLSGTYMFVFLLILQALVAAALVTVILMQRSEGGGLGMGGSPTGLMSARGASDFLTRATSVLATAFIVLCVVLAAMAATRHSAEIDTSLARTPAAQPPSAPARGDALGAAANQVAPDEQAPADNSVPLAQ